MNSLTLRRLLKHVWFWFLWRSGATSWAKGRLANNGATVILTLHRVVPLEQLLQSNSPSGMLLSLPTATALVSFIRQHASSASLAASVAAPLRSKKVAVALTFDDGWEDNYKVCTKLLYPFSIPATIFVCPALLERSQPFWPERAISLLNKAQVSREAQGAFAAVLSKYSEGPRTFTDASWIKHLKALPLPLRGAILEELIIRLGSTSTAADNTMTWEQIRHLSSLGFEIGAHTNRHELLPSLSKEEQWEELLEPRDMMLKQLGHKPLLFSYPNGDTTAQLSEMVREAGYQNAFVNAPGVWHTGTHPFLIPRNNVSEARLLGINGQFSAASAHYLLFWLPYRQRSLNARHEADLPRQLLDTSTGS